MKDGVTMDPTTTEVAILLDAAVNKYHPGCQVFRLQSVNGMQENSNLVETIPIHIPNLMNKDVGALALGEAKITSVIKMELPRDVTRNYPVKFIPMGTRFIVSFNSADITKPVVVGREFS